MTKVDRALGMAVIDWLQFKEFPDKLGEISDADMAQHALTFIHQMRNANGKLVEALKQMDRVQFDSGDAIHELERRALIARQVLSDLGVEL